VAGEHGSDDHVEAQGVRVPALGFGTWQLSGSSCYEAVRHALDLGHRHVDTAQMYGNEEEVGAALRDSDVERDEVFLTTKIPPRNLDADAVRSSHEGSLRRLGVDHVDLLLIHWPSRDVPLGETLTAMAELADRGLARHLGVSNFTPRLVEEALEHAPILTNQVEYHPYLDQSHLVDQCRELDLVLTAYSPLAKGRVVDDPTLTAIGAGHGKSAAQVAIRWLLDKDRVVVIPRSSSAEHRRANRDVLDFTLSDGEVERVDALARGERLIDPPFAPDWRG
jgi:2,5-diketo-D-gluconate reductase B